MIRPSRNASLGLQFVNDMVPRIGVECVCLSGAMLAKAGSVLDVCLVGGIDCGRWGMCECWFLSSSSFHASSVLIGVLGWGAVRALF